MKNFSKKFVLAAAVLILTLQSFAAASECKGPNCGGPMVASQPLSQPILIPERITVLRQYYKTDVYRWGVFRRRLVPGYIITPQPLKLEAK